MSCDKCQELVQTIEIRNPGDLEMVLRVVKAYLRDRTIVQRPAEPGSVVPRTVVENMNERGQWADVVEAEFRCTACGQQFRLEAETYHGAGGFWRPTA